VELLESHQGRQLKKESLRGKKEKKLGREGSVVGNDNRRDLINFFLKRGGERGYERILFRLKERGRNRWNITDLHKGFVKKGKWECEMETFFARENKSDVSFQREGGGRKSDHRGEEQMREGTCWQGGRRKS